MKKHLGITLVLLISVVFAGCKTEKEKSKANNMETEEISKLERIELLVGTFTKAESKGIYKLDFNPQNGELGNKTLLVERENPGYLYISKDRSAVYSSNSGAPGSISVYGFNDDRSRLNLIGDYPSEGNGACYVELNGKENLLAASNYGSGNIVVYRLNEEGNVIKNPKSFQHQGSGPHPHQKSAHAHCVKFDGSGKFLYAVDLGIDEVLAYRVANDTILNQPITALKLDDGDGPRHLIFHPTKNWAFVINELSSTVVSAKVNSKTGGFERIDKQSTLPKDFEGTSYCADIHLSPNGKFLYASNRGHNSIAIFSISGVGELKLLATEPVRGDWPRNFTLSPDGSFLLVANQNSNTIVVFKVDSESGSLTFTGNEIELSSPVCLKF